MSRLFKILGFLFSWIAPFGVIYVNHIVLEDASWNVTVSGLMIVFLLGIALVKRIDKECEVWKINKENKIFRLNWSNGKKILIMVSVTWFLYTIEASFDKIQLSALLISISFVIGYVFSLLGNLKQNREVRRLA